MAEDILERVDRIRASITAYLFLAVAVLLLKSPSGFERLLALGAVAWGGLQTLPLLFSLLPAIRLVALGYLICFVLVFAGGWGGSDERAGSRAPSRAARPERPMPVRESPPPPPETEAETPDERTVPPRDIAATPPFLPQPVPSAPGIPPNPPPPPLVEQPPVVESEPPPARPLVEVLGEVVADARRAESRRELEAVMSHYAPVVEYFGKPTNRAEIRQDKAEYFARWPRASETIDNRSLKVTETGSGRADVTFTSTFRVESDERNAWFSGTIANEYTFAREGGGPWHIVAQRGAVSDTANGTLREVAPAPPRAEPVAEEPPPLRPPPIDRGSYAGNWDGRLPPSDDPRARGHRFRLIVSPDLQEIHYVNDIKMSPRTLRATTRMDGKTLHGQVQFRYQRSSYNIQTFTVTFTLTPIEGTDRARATFVRAMKESRFPTNRPEVSSFSGEVNRARE